MASRTDIPGRTAYLVNDYAGVLDKVTKQHLEGMLRDMRDNKPMHTEVVVSTFKSLGGKSFDDFFVRYLRRWWRFPLVERHNRIQVVIIVGDGKMRIGVGDGITGVVTGEMRDRIMREIMLPDFERGDYSSGIRKGVETIVAILSNAKTAR
jgi:uncharacterized protein